MDNTIRNKPEHSLVDFFKKSAALFVKLSPALLIAFFATRFIEFVYISKTNNLPERMMNIIVKAAVFDILFFLELLPVLFVPFLIMCGVIRSTKYRAITYGFGGTIAILVYAALIKYFAAARVPLGADLFGYSIHDIRTTIRGSVRIDLISAVLFTVPLALFWGMLPSFYSRNLIKPAYAVLTLSLGIVLTFTVSSVLPAYSTGNTELVSNLILNKFAFFAKDSYTHFCGSIYRNAGASANISDDKPTGSMWTVQDGSTEYPFMRPDRTPDVLGEFFTITPAAPNIVFILVEGLGRAFSGPNAYLGSFTPFLDELAGKSLYWENFLAAQGRTFAALPSILGSLPFADQGFSELGPRMPNHLTVLSILKHNGYRIKFYFGSDLDFDNARLFLKRQGVDVLVGKEDYDGNYKKSPGSSWGYPDRELMRKSLEMESRDQKQPYVTFIQTMSMHTSYSVPDQEKYLRLFEDQMNRLKFDEGQKEKHRTYKEIYSTILYTDEALRFFFDEYSKLPGYANTVFIITGDHRLPEIPMSTKIDRFHVPLIIYSPLLKRTAHIQSISSHLDLAPSLLAFLKKNCHLDTPSSVAWVGSGLDTNPSFRNIHRYPLKHTKNNLIDYISGMYFVDQDVLFSIGKNMDLEPMENESKRNELIAEFNRYKSINDRFTRELKLIPVSLYEQYRSR